MNKIPALGLVLLVAGCAVDAPREALPISAAETSAPAMTNVSAPIAATSEVESIDIKELDNGLVCESARRAGSRIAQRVCYTREEYAAIAAAQGEQAKEFALEMDRQQRNAEMIQQQQEQERQRGAMQSTF